ncbi:NLPA lipoprotein [Mitsuokella sp. oral taxon 131 str. W9106]|nr:NLPA lipoprotein [Mitsuokella sp. oral taxon 131 str. W9106]
MSKEGLFMKWKRTAVFALGVLTAASVLASGCGGQEGQKEIQLGATSGPHAEVAEAVAKEAANQGLKVKVVEFSDYVTPDQALADGDIDLNSYQHEPFLENFNAKSGAHLTSIGTTILMRMGIYSDKVHDVQDVPDGAKVAIPNDPTNGGRALMLLAKAGLITIPENNFKVTVQDIQSNPKHLQFVELEAAQLPRSLSDVDIAVITMNYVMSGGLDVGKQGIFLEDKTEPLAVMVLAVREKDKDNEAYQKIAKIFHSEAVKRYIADHYKGTIVPAE